MWSDSDAAAFEKSLSLATKTSATERQSRASATDTVSGSFTRITVCPDESRKKGKINKVKLNQAFRDAKEIIVKNHAWALPPHLTALDRKLLRRTAFVAAVAAVAAIAAVVVRREFGC